MSGNPVLSDPTSQADSSSTSGNTDTSESTSLSTKRTSSNALENDNNEKNKKLKESVKSPKRLAHEKKFKQKSGCVEDPKFYITHGLRCIAPYLFRFVSFAKKRWLNTPLIDIFGKEFRVEPIEYFRQAIVDGRILVNNRTVKPNYIVRQSDCIVHIAHRHEPPVTAKPIKIIAETESILVVDKPATIPVHVAGKYNFNTLIEILKRENGYSTLSVCHRLDKLTSGVTILAKTSQESARIHKLIVDHKVEKSYICKVKGIFPEEEITCEEPLEVLSHKFGLSAVSPTGKQALTVFKRVSTDGNTSTVICNPKTGRLHQIRVHLQFLGFPIENDLVYNHSAWGPNLAKGGLTLEEQRQVVINFSKILNTEDSISDSFVPQQASASSDSASTSSSSSSSTSSSSASSNLESTSSTSDLVEETNTEEMAEGKIDLDDLLQPTNKQPDGNLEEEETEVNISDKNLLSYCLECRRTRSLPDPDACIFLHAWKYKSEFWEYSTEFPSWAST